MEIMQAMHILHIVKCDNLGYCRDLSYTPSPEEIGQAIQVVENLLETLGIDF